MTRLLGCLFAVGMMTAVSSSASAALVLFNLQGNAGIGLLPGNENPSANSSGTGGEVDPGIIYNDANRELTINIGWGTSLGFTNLTGPVTVMHIHGPTPSGGTASFSENVPPLIDLHTLAGFNNAADGGGFNGIVTLTELQESQLLEGRFYINAHTVVNPGGEIRGNLVAVPEPSCLGLCALALSGIMVRRHRKPASV